MLLSLLAELIIVALYALFIRDQLVGSFTQLNNAELLMDVWMIAGILGITSFTTTMGAYGVMVDDKVKKINRDFEVAPIRNATLLGGYLIAAVVIGLILSFLTLLAAEGYISYQYGVRLGAGQMTEIYGVLLLVTVSNAAQVLLLVSFLKSSNALAACCTILGAMIGFLTGIYLPMGTIPDSVQTLVKCCPISHGVVLLRQILIEPLLSGSFSAANAPQAAAFQEYMGIQYVWDGAWLSAQSSVLILLAAAGSCLVLAIAKFSLQKRE